MAIFGLGDKKDGEGTSPETNEAGENSGEGGDPKTPEESSPSEVVVVDDDGEYLGEVMTSEEADALQAQKQYCEGLFSMLTVADFTQDPKYSDEYLKSKGLFKEVEEVDEDEV